MKTPPDVPCSIDMETLAVNAFKAEGAYLHHARLSADALRRRLEAANPSVQRFVLSRDELAELTTRFAQAVDIASEYHIDAAEIDAA